MFCGVLTKICTNLTRHSNLLKPTHLQYLTTHQFESTSAKESVHNWITSLEEDKQKRVKMIQNEIAIRLAESKRMPKLERINVADYVEMMEMTRSRRQRYYTYLFASTTAETNEEAKKNIRNRIYEEKRRLGILGTPETNHIRYGLGHNNQFLKIPRPITVKWGNLKLYRAMKLDEPKIIFDCGFEDTMTSMEISDLARQIKISFSENRLHCRPFVLNLCNFNSHTQLWHQLSNRIMTNFRKLPWNIYANDVMDHFPVEKLVYLTPDSPNVLKHFNVDDYYIIGAIVDKAMQQPLTLAKSKKFNIRSARLPLDQFVRFQSHKNLTLDAVIRILLEIRRSNDWNKALKNLPSRKVCAA